MPIKWPHPIDWKCPAGELLTKLSQVIPPERRSPILVFGSAALQLTIAPTVLSADADVAPDIDTFDSHHPKFSNPLDRPELHKIVVQNGLGPAQSKLHLHVCARNAFDPGTGYVRRVMEVPVGNIVLVVPHPIDILVAKLHRYDAKDKEDFQEVYRRTGFPSPDELLAVLRSSFRMFHVKDTFLEHMPPQFDPSKIRETTPKVFQDLYGKHISVKQDILAYAHKDLESSYSSPTRRGDLDAIADQPISTERQPDLPPVPSVPKVDTNSQSEQRPEDDLPKV